MGVRIGFRLGGRLGGLGLMHWDVVAGSMLAPRVWTLAAPYRVAVKHQGYDIMLW